MTLLGQFALWVAFLVGLWCVIIALSGRYLVPASRLRGLANLPKGNKAVKRDGA